MGDWSPFAADVLHDPGSGHSDLLEHCPVHHCTDFDPPFYTLVRYDDVAAALRDIETYSSHHGQGPRFTDPQGMLCDPPQHTHMRRLVQPAFAPRAMAALRTEVDKQTQRLIEDLKDGPDRFDLHDDFAFPLPVVIIAGMLGIPEADLVRFKHWSDVQVAAMGAADPSIYAEEQAAFFKYMNGALVGRRQALANESPVPDDLLTLIAGARSEDGNTLIEIADAQSMLQQLLVGGNETTTSLIANLVWRLLTHTEQWSALLEDRSLIPNAIEESLRFDPPVLGLYRSTTRQVSLHGVDIPEGAKVYINYAAANRDPRVFDHPDEFDIRRDRGRHMSFGLGVHFCLGAPMARMEAEIALNALLDTFPELSLEGDGERIAPFFLWGRKHLPVRKGRS